MYSNIKFKIIGIMNIVIGIILLITFILHFTNGLSFSYFLIILLPTLILQLLLGINTLLIRSKKNKHQN